MNAGNNLITFEINTDNKSLCGRFFFFFFYVHNKKIIQYFLVSLCSYDFSNTSIVKERCFNYGAWVYVYCGSSVITVGSRIDPLLPASRFVFHIFFYSCHLLRDITKKRPLLHV